MSARSNPRSGELSVELSESALEFELSEPALEFETGWGVVTVGGTGSLAMICVLDLAEYLALAERRGDTLYMIRG